MSKLSTFFSLHHHCHGQIVGVLEVCMCVCAFSSAKRVTIFNFSSFLFILLESVYMHMSIQKVLYMDCIIFVDEIQKINPIHTQPTQAHKQITYVSLLFPARLQFHLFHLSHIHTLIWALRVVLIIFHTFYFDYYSYTYMFVCRIIFSHGTGSLSFVLFLTHLASFIHSGFTGMPWVCARVYVYLCLHTHSRDMILN